MTHVRLPSTALLPCRDGALQFRTKNKSSNYLISKDSNDLNKASPNFLGKLRSNFIGTEFAIYDNGQSEKAVSKGGSAGTPKRKVASERPGTGRFASNVWVHAGSGVHLLPVEHTRVEGPPQDDGSAAHKVGRRARRRCRFDTLTEAAGCPAARARSTSARRSRAGRT